MNINYQNAYNASIDTMLASFSNKTQAKTMILKGFAAGLSGEQIKAVAKMLKVNAADLQIAYGDYKMAHGIQE